MFDWLRAYKNYVMFIISLALFSVIIIFSLIIYIGFNDELIEESGDSEFSVEVNLPVLNVQKYSNLSKQYSDDNIQ